MGNKRVNTLLREKSLLKTNYDLDIFTNQWMADFETVTAKTKFYKRYKRTKITYGYMENLQYDNQNCEFIDIYDMFNFFKWNCRNDQTVYFHYLGFDGTFILDWLGRNGARATNGYLRNDYDFNTFRTTGRKIYKIQVLIRNKYRKKLIITFLCSKELLQVGVKQLGKNVELAKYKEGQETKEFHIVEPARTLLEFKEKNKEYVAYCKRDVQIVKKSLVPFKIELFELMKARGYEKHFVDVNKCMTTAAISLALQKLELLKQGYKEKDIYIQEYAEREIMDKFTNGGMVILNERFRARSLRNVKGYMIDIKSAYPSVMRQPVPLGEMIMTKPHDYTPEKYACFQEIHYDHIWSKNNHTVPLLKNWNPKKYGLGYLYMTQAKDYTTYMLKDEMELIEQLYEYDNKTIINEYYYKLASPFTDLIDHFYMMKEKYKKDNPAKSYLYKILLNAGYGVHAKRYDFTTVFVERKDGKYKDKHYTYKVKEHIDLNKRDRVTHVPNNRFVATKNECEKQLFQYAHKAMGNYITAKTHCILLKAIIDIGVEHFLYTDTDSIQMYGIPKEQVLKLCGKEIGQWELETWYDKDGNEYDHFTDVRINRSKQYILENNKVVIKKRIAGVSRADDLDIEYLEKHGLHLNIDQAFLKTLRVKGGLILVECSKQIDIKDNFYESGVWMYGCNFFIKK